MSELSSIDWDSPSRPSTTHGYAYGQYHEIRETPQIKQRIYANDSLQCGFFSRSVCRQALRDCHIPEFHISRRKMGSATWIQSWRWYNCHVKWSKFEKYFPFRSCPTSICKWQYLKLNFFQNHCFASFFPVLVLKSYCLIFCVQDAFEIVESDWEVSTYKWIGETTKSIDMRQPSREEVLQIQQRFNDYYPDMKIDITELEPIYRWTSGFNQRIPPRDTIREGDDIAVYYNPTNDAKLPETRTTAYVRVGRCLEILVNSRAFFFIFPYWYSTPTTRRVIQDGFRVKIVQKWTQNASSLPITPKIFISRFLAVHNCTRSCPRAQRKCKDPLSCRCNKKCRLLPYCPAHQNYNCNQDECRAGLIMHDVHHQDIKDFIVFDCFDGFRNKM